MIELRDVSKQFGDLAALHPLHLVFDAGKTTILIGPSGCGKSTILRLIAGLIEPTSGSIIVEGQTLTAANVLSLRRRMGYVIQDGGLFPHLTARENITLMARHLREPSARTEERLREICELTRFPESGLDRFPVQLSGGQKQRVSLMRALMPRPDVLLLDEPLGALDPMVRAALQTDLQDIFQNLGQTAIMVTHDLAEAAHFGDEIILLNEGRVVQKGTLDDLRERPATPFVSEFFQAQRSLIEL